MKALLLVIVVAVTVRELPVPVRTAVPATTSHTVAAATNVSVAVMVMLAGLAAPPAAVEHVARSRQLHAAHGSDGLRQAGDQGGVDGAITRRTGAACSSTSRAF